MDEPQLRSMHDRLKQGQQIPSEQSAWLWDMLSVMIRKYERTGPNAQTMTELGLICTGPEDADDSGT